MNKTQFIKATLLLHPMATSIAYFLLQIKKTYTIPGIHNSPAILIIDIVDTLMDIYPTLRYDISRTDLIPLIYQIILNIVDSGVFTYKFT